ncbi:MAG: hypothetical protein U9P36_09595 [Thermodesulfobacteriota bacterium]|nr:hypothetical protein [Thermodesulfobacteriota bacterium]
MNHLVKIYPVILLLLLLGGCARVPGPQVPDQVAPLMVEQELAESELLNVSIKVFDQGELPANSDKANGLSPEIRAAEARFVPVHLKYTLQRTGYWGAVRVVPDDDVGTDLLVRGSIVYSDGESLVLSVEAVDSTNRIWMNKTYAETAKPPEHDKGAPGRSDTFQDLFNTIANDLILIRNRLSPEDVAGIRNVAELRYAASMAPDAFGAYLQQGAAGRFVITRRPSPEDPMLTRVRNVRSRDDMLVDTINSYYDAYYQDLWEPYTDWRKFRSEELSTLRDLERQALTRQVLGIASIVGAIALGAAADYDTRAQTSTLRDVMVIGGAAAVYSGVQKKEESRINREVIEELGTSFSSEAEPLVIEVDGETLRLAGSAEQQYTRWREILRKIYARKTGLLPEASAIPGNDVQNHAGVEAPEKEETKPE